MRNKALFISHASKDRVLVDEFVDLLDTGCGMPRNQIFCTSLPDLGIQPGQDYVQYVKEHILNASLVVLMISPNFYDSVFCLCELGVTWVLENQVFPIVIPDIELGQVRDILSVTQMGMITDPLYLDCLRDAVLKLYGLPDSPTATWTHKREQFISRLPQLLSQLPKPLGVPTTQYEKLLQTYQESRERLSNSQAEIVCLNEMIARLKAAKDKTDEQAVLVEYPDDFKKFDDLKKDARAALQQLPSIVRKAFYLVCLGEPFVIASDTWDRGYDLDEALEAQRNGYLLAHPELEYGYVPNYGDAAVKDASDNIERLSNFLEYLSPDGEFGKYFYDEHGYDGFQAIRNKRFWTRHLFFDSVWLYT